MTHRKHKNDHPTFAQIRHFDNKDEKEDNVDQQKRKYPNTTKGLKRKH